MGGTSSTLQSWRERPPSYSLKIQNFSEFEKSTLSSEGKYESSIFSSGGYNWRMIVYPFGNDKEEGDGFISMYVEKIDTTSLMSTPTTTDEVFADLRFFIFNKKRNMYFAIQYTEPKPFNTLRTVWGIPQMLMLDMFNDNGYIFDGDQCEFGVDVIVSPPRTNWEILSFDQRLRRPKFSWSLKNFSELEEDSYKSSSFSMGERNWYLRLYPKGNARGDGKWLSIFLCVSESETIKEDEKIFVQAIFRVVDPRGSKHSSRNLNCWYRKSNIGRGAGYSQFVALVDLPKTYLDKEDTLTIEVEFEVVSSTKYSLPNI